MPNHNESRAADALSQQQPEEQQPTAQTANVFTAAAGATAAANSPNVDFAAAETSQRSTSDAQYAANRANAKKSTGPTSSEGKAKSCLNAVKTGLTGQTVLLASDDAQAYQAHLDRHFSRYAPIGDEEHTLVQFIADTEFRLLRIAPLEAGIYAMGRLKLPADLFPEENNPAVREALMRAEIFTTYRRDLSNIALQERRLRNQHKADCEKLQALQLDRKTKEKAAADAQQISMRRAVSALLAAQFKKEPFNPADFGFDFSLAEVEHFNACYRAAQKFGGDEPRVETVLAAFRQTKEVAQTA